MIEVYTKDNCKYCIMSKTLLTSFNKEFSTYKLDEDFTIDKLKEKFPSARTFPVIVIDGVFIGGYEQLKTHIQNI